MRVSESWLRDWVDAGIDTDALAHRLTMAGLEIGAVETAAPEFSGVVVGSVVECAGHPDADKLSVCEVTTGDDDTASIVCGAPNVRKGLKVAVARVGARLPGDLKIRKAKLRGVVSMGMICSARELGLGEEHDGILELPDDAPVGNDLREYLDLDDRILELDLTPNRGDCLGMAGVAREVGALCEAPVRQSEASEVPGASDATFNVELSAPDGCPRYAGRVVEGIDPSAATPLWMVERLRRAGVRSLGPVVDVTNYVMLETGQPMHGFDLAQLKEKIDVRWAHKGETLTLLDGRDVTLDPDVLVIADGGGAVALAGIMGGEGSGVSDSTRDIFFESAFFAPQAVAGRARRFGLHTDASHRFERGVDPDGQVAALERATELLLAIAGGRAGQVVVAENSAHLAARAEVALEADRLANLLGTQVSDAAVTGIFERLGFSVTTRAGGWQVTPPGFRFDIALPEDLIEEVARVHGYDAIPERYETASLTLHSAPEGVISLSRIQDALVDRGYQEVITYSFVDAGLQSELNPQSESLALTNPISADLAVMRTSLWPGLVSSVRHNLARQQGNLRFFEHGLIFRVQDNEIKQVRRIGAALTGNREAAHWDERPVAADFYDLAGDLGALLALGGDPSRARFEVASHPALHPGQSARIYVNNEPAGWLGALHPERARALDIEQETFLFELDLDALQAAEIPAYRAISRFPALRRDISIVVNEDVTIDRLIAAVREAAPSWLRDLSVFDIYRGQGIDSGTKSVSFGLILQDSSRTLNDSQADEAVQRVTDRLKQEFNGRIR